MYPSEWSSSKVGSYFFSSSARYRFLILIIVGFKGKIKTHNRAFRKEMEETSAKVMEMVEMIPVTKAHALEDQEARKMSEQLRKVAEKGLQLDMIQTYFSSISWVAFRSFRYSVLHLQPTLHGKESSVSEISPYTRLIFPVSSLRLQVL